MSDEEPGVTRAHTSWFRPAHNFLIRAKERATVNSTYHTLIRRCLEVREVIVRRKRFARHVSPSVLGSVSVAGLSPHGVRVTASAALALLVVRGPFGVEN